MPTSLRVRNHPKGNLTLHARRDHYVDSLALAARDLTKRQVRKSRVRSIPGPDLRGGERGGVLEAAVVWGQELLRPGSYLRPRRGWAHELE